MAGLKESVPVKFTLTVCPLETGLLETVNNSEFKEIFPDLYQPIPKIGLLPVGPNTAKGIIVTFPVSAF